MSVRLATLDDPLGALTDLINESYKIGEKGIFVDTEEFPFLRHTQAEVTALVEEKKLLLLISDDEAVDIIGCVKANDGVEELDDGSKVGEWGSLAVVEQRWGHGLGSVLQKAAEEHLAQCGCSVAQLELLTPTHWEHDHKNRLKRWYVDKLGYQLKTGDYASSTTRFTEGTMLLKTGQLACDAEFTIYRRSIGA